LYSLGSSVLTAINQRKTLGFFWEFSSCIFSTSKVDNSGVSLKPMMCNSVQCMEKCISEEAENYPFKVLWSLCVPPLLIFQNSTFCPQFILWVLYVSQKNSEFCHTQQSMIGFYNRNGKCLLRGTDWVFRLHFVLKESNRKSLLSLTKQTLAFRKKYHNETSMATWSNLPCYHPHSSHTSCFKPVFLNLCETAA